MSDFDVTLQVNLSPGDVAYARETVPALVRTHQQSIKSTLAVVDCCKPQRTKRIEPEKDYPEPAFSRRVHQICEIAEGLKADGWIDDVVYLRPGDAIFPRLTRKFLRNVIGGTHDAKGTPILAYLAGLEMAPTRYVLHFDADMLVHQQSGYAWVEEATRRMQSLPRAVIATPRVSPPFASRLGTCDATSLHTGPVPEIVDGGWLVNWFSTRCFLVDRERLDLYLPLARGSLLLEVLARRVLKRDHPMALEMMMCRTIGGDGGRRLDLNTDKAWILHPAEKREQFLRLLPGIIAAVAEGRVPEEQRGWEDLQLDAWERMLDAAAVPSPAMPEAALR